MSENNYTQLEERILAALDVATWGQMDGAHHKMWVIDQMVRALTGDDYEEWVTSWCRDDNDGLAYVWDEGVAP